LKNSGAGRVDYVRLAGRRPDLDSARAALEAADIIVISGGDVAHGMEVLTRTGMIPTLRALWEAGVPFCGGSAGGVMLSSGWLRWTDPKDDGTATPFDCLGFAPVGYGIVKNAALRVQPDGSVAALGGPAHRLRHETAGVKRIDDLEPWTAAGSSASRGRTANPPGACPRRIGLLARNGSATLSGLTVDAMML
jgi:hypothetical protein